jgi:hypothetical protein
MNGRIMKPQATCLTVARSGVWWNIERNDGRRRESSLIRIPAILSAVLARILGL